MNSLIYYIKTYILIEIQYIKGRMQYRLDFFASFAAIFISNAGTLLAFWVLFNSITKIEGWSFYEIVFIYSFCILATNPMDVLFSNLWEMGNTLQQGTFIKYYFRPLNMLFYYISESFDLKSLSNLVFGIPTFIYSAHKIGIHWNLASLSLLFVILLGSSLIVIAMMLAAASISFWTISSYSVIALASKFKEFARYPVTIFRGFYRILFTFVIPTAFIAFYPSQLFLRPNQSNILPWLSPFIGAICFMLAYRLWLKGVNKYTGTGT